MSWNDLYVLLPMLVVIAWALVLLLVDLWIPRGNKGITAGLAAIGMAAALGLTLSQRGQSPKRNDVPPRRDLVPLHQGFALYGTKRKP